VEITAKVTMKPEKGTKVAETELGQHTQELSFVGDEGGRLTYTVDGAKVPGGYGDADHLGQMVTQVDDIAKNVSRAAVAKAHDYLTTAFAEFRPAPEAGLQALAPPGSLSMVPEPAPVGQEAQPEAPTPE